MTYNQAFQAELRRLAFKSRLTPVLAVVWIVGTAIIVGAWISPQSWTTSALNAVTWVVFAVVIGVAMMARNNIRRE